MRERRWRRGMRALLVAAATLPALLVAGCVSVPFSSGVEVGGAVDACAVQLDLGEVAERGDASLPLRPRCKGSRFWLRLRRLWLRLRLRGHAADSQEKRKEGTLSSARRSR